MIRALFCSPQLAQSKFAAVVLDVVCTGCGIKTEISLFSGWKGRVKKVSPEDGARD